MTETVAVNFRILPETVSKLDWLARKTFRGKGDLIDWMTEKFYKEMCPESIPAEEQAQSANDQGE